MQRDVGGDDRVRAGIACVLESQRSEGEDQAAVGERRGRGGAGVGRIGGGVACAVLDQGAAIDGKPTRVGVAPRERHRAAADLADADGSVAILDRAAKDFVRNNFPSVGS